MVGSEKFGSGEYKPTPSALFPAFINGVPSGFTCLVCGHLQVELDEFWDDICPMCLREWAKKHIPRLIPVAEAVDKTSPLSPTVHVIKPTNEQTTILMDFTDGSSRSTTKSGSTRELSEPMSDVFEDNDLFGD
jgi:hypothetical protein